MIAFGASPQPWRKQQKKLQVRKEPDMISAIWRSAGPTGPGAVKASLHRGSGKEWGREDLVAGGGKKGGEGDETFIFFTAAVRHCEVADGDK